MSDLHLSLEDSIKLAGGAGAQREIRALGALSAAAILLQQPMDSAPNHETLDVLESLLDAVQAGIDKARENARG